MESLAVYFRSWDLQHITNISSFVRNGIYLLDAADSDDRERYMSFSRRMDRRSKRKGRDPLVKYNIPYDENMLYRALDIADDHKAKTGLRLLAFITVCAEGKTMLDNDTNRSTWKAITLPSSLCIEATTVAGGKSLKEILPLAVQVWQALPDSLRAERLASFGVSHDRSLAPDDTGIIQTKLTAADWHLVRLIGEGNRSRGARIVLRTLVAVLAAQKENPS